MQLSQPKNRYRGKKSSLCVDTRYRPPPPHPPKKKKITLTYGCKRKKKTA